MSGTLNRHLSGIPGLCVLAVALAGCGKNERRVEVERWTTYEILFESDTKYSNGFISRSFEGFDFTDMERRWDLTEGNKPLLAKEGSFYISYMENGGEIKIRDVPAGLPYVWFDPVTGEFRGTGRTTLSETYRSPGQNPWALIIGERTANK